MEGKIQKPRAKRVTKYRLFGGGAKGKRHGKIWHEALLFWERASDSPLFHALALFFFCSGIALALG
jgi:hypothetical protein